MRSLPPQSEPQHTGHSADVVKLFPTIRTGLYDPSLRPARLAPREALTLSPSKWRGAIHARREYDFADMVRLCRLHRYAQRTQIDHLRLLAGQAGLPLPKNPRIHAGQVLTGAARIGSRSVWCALEVDAWLDDQRSPPPAGGGALDVPPLPLADRDDMRQRACLLAGGQR